VLGNHHDNFDLWDSKYQEYFKGAKNDFSIERLLEMHRSISYKTLYNPKDEGVFRKNDDIYVVDGITGSVSHTPPSFM